MNDYTQFIKVIEEFILLFDTLIDIEQNKLEAALANKVSLIEDYMNKEQAAILAFRGLEQRREKEQEKLGLAGQKFRDILKNVPEDTAVTLTPLFQEMSQRVQDFQAVSASSKQTIEVRLHTIQAALASEQQTYSPQGKKTEGQTHFTSYSV